MLSAARHRVTIHGCSLDDQITVPVLVSYQDQSRLAATDALGQPLRIAVWGTGASKRVSLEKLP